MSTLLAFVRQVLLQLCGCACSQQLTIEERAKRLGVEIDVDPRTIAYILSIEESYFTDTQ